MSNQPVASTWHKSTYSNGERSCVEVADLEIPGSGVAVRDSTRPDAGHLAFSTNAWTTLLSAVRHEEL